MSFMPVVTVVHPDSDNIVITITGSESSFVVEFHFSNSSQLVPLSLIDQTQIISCESISVGQFTHNAHIKLGKYFHNPSTYKCVFQGYTETKNGPNFSAKYTEILSVNGPVGEQIDILFW